MDIYVVIWTVLMIFWLFLGSWRGYIADANGRIEVVGGTLIPFLCVLILGLLYFGAIGTGHPVAIVPVR